MAMGNVWSELSRKKPFLALAPMYDVTDVSFREVVAEAAAPDVFFTEFVNCEALQSARGRAVHLSKLKFTEKQRPVIAQIWGVNPDSYFKTAQLIRGLGLDGIDINMGCPEKSVMKIGAGSALIGQYGLVAEILQATREGAQELPVSVKTRIGVKTIVTDDWIGWLLEQKLPALTIHGRTAREMSDVPAHWDEIKRSVELRNKKQVETLIVGNGDVRNAKEAQVIAREFEVDGVMIGRGIFQDLYVFDQIKRWDEEAVQKKIQWLKRHIVCFEQYRDEYRNYEVMKKFVKIYLNGFPQAKIMREEAMRASGLRELKEIVDRLEKEVLHSNS